MSFEQLLEKMDHCPLCLDISYTDADGMEHLLFDLCEIHQRVSDHTASQVGSAEVDAPDSLTHLEVRRQGQL